ncbi:glutathione S-transferase family protein [Marinimicrococcus flavescens]|uniref:glutathione S-transferase family protein n=1 Tax=Marinimicrococcus flavescens TaxID=3031815 RepID=UPI002E185A1F
MTRLQLVIGPRRLSSWSLRAWLVLERTGLAFEEIVVRYDRPGGAARIGEFSPSRRVPVLLVDGTPVWDSLAICEYLAEQAPDLWPAEPLARACARSVSCEMHSGFRDLRAFLPMDFTARFAGPPVLLPRVEADVRRIVDLWGKCREQWGREGPFLFGRFSIADAMFAPVASRFLTHGVRLGSAAQAYVEALMAMPAMVAWGEAAAAEEGGEELVATSQRAGAPAPPRRPAPPRVVPAEARPSRPEPSRPEPPRREAPHPEPLRPEPARTETPAVAPPQPVAMMPSPQGEPPPSHHPRRAQPELPQPAPESAHQPTAAAPSPAPAAGEPPQASPTRGMEHQAAAAVVPVRRNWLRGGSARAAEARLGGVAERADPGPDRTPRGVSEPPEDQGRRVVRNPAIKPIGDGTRRRR